MPATKLDDLEHKKDEIRASLDSLMNSTQEADKQKFQEQMEQQLKEFNDEIGNFQPNGEEEKQKFDALNAEVDEIKAEYEKAKSDLASLQATVEQAQQTSQEVQEKEEASKSSETSGTQETEKKGFWGATKEFFGNLFSREKWKSETGKNLGRASGLAIGGGILIGAWKWIFGEKKEDSEKGGKKKKGFWSKVGKFFKWAGIGLGVGTLGYWIARRLGRIKEGDATDSAGNQAKNTIELKEKDPEKYQKYKEVGENVDSQYNDIMGKEIAAGWTRKYDINGDERRGGIGIADGYEKYADKNKVDKDVFQATVPMSIDNQFGSVSEFLSEGGYYAYLRGLKFTELKNEILSWPKEKIGSVVGPFLSTLTSYVPFVGQNWSEGIKRWFESGDPAEREAELQLFFREYAKVLNYTQDKLRCLKEKIAEEKLRNNTDGDFSTAEDALNDSEWVEKHICSDVRYKNFVNGKLYQAVDVMKNNGIFDASLSYDMEKVKKYADAERDVILKFNVGGDGKDALQRLEAAGDNLTDLNYTEGKDCCEGIVEDIKDEFDKSVSYLYFGCVHEAVNTNENNIQEFLKYSGFNDLKSGLIESMSEFKQKFESHQITPEEITLYKNQVNSYFAMKKEVLIGARAIQQMKSDNPNYTERILNVGGAVFSDLIYHTTSSIKHFKDEKYVTAWIEATIPIYLGGSVLKAFGKSKGSKKAEVLGNFIKKTNLFSLLWEGRGAAARRVFARDINKLPNFLLKARYDIAHGDQLLLQDLIDGKIHGDRVTKLLKDGNKNWVNLEGRRANSIAEFVQKMLGSDSTTMSAKHIDILFNNKADIVLMKNSSLRKMIFGEPKISFGQKRGKVIWNGYRRKIYSPTGFNHVEALEEFMIGKSGRTPVFDTLSKEQKKLAKHLLERGEFGKIEEVTAFLSNVKNFKLDGFDDKQIARLVEELAENTNELSDMAKIESRIMNVKNGVLADETLKAKYSVFNDIEGQRVELRRLQNEQIDEYARLNNKLSTVTEGSDEYKAIQKQMALIEEKEGKFADSITHLDDFEKELLAGGEQKILKVNEVLDVLGSKNFTKAIDNITIISKLEDLKDAKGNKIYSDFSDIIKKFDYDELKRLGINFDDLGGEKVVKSMKSIINNIRKLEGTRLFSNLDELCDVLKVVRKIAKVF